MGDSDMNIEYIKDNAMPMQSFNVILENIFFLKMTYACLGNSRRE